MEEALVILISLLVVLGGFWLKRLLPARTSFTIAVVATIILMIWIWGFEPASKWPKIIITAVVISGLFQRYKRLTSSN